MIRTTLLMLCVLLGWLGTAHAQDVVVRPLFESDSPLHLTIEGPFRRLAGDGRERPERDGLIRYSGADGTDVVLDVAIRVRGNSRLELCSRPPLRLNLRRGQLEGTVFAGQNQLKLVTLCRSRDAYRDYLAQEYQIYRAYNALTDRSFRVRWVSVEYVETTGRRPASTTEPAFFIEEDWEVAERHGMEVVETDTLAVAALDARATALLSLFQYLIANTDWSGTSAREGEDCCHNGSVLGLPDGDLSRLILPYDFDHAGVIDTSYAKPSPNLGIRSVTQRLYRGYCATNQQLSWALARMNEKHTEVVGAFDSESVSECERDRATAYLNDGYAIINDPLRWQTEIVERCRG